MSYLDSILKTLESIKKKYSSFKIKVSSVRLFRLEYSDGEKLFDLLTTYNVAQLNVVYGMNEIIGVPVP